MDTQHAAARFIDHVTGGPLGPVDADRSALAMMDATVERRWEAIAEALADRETFAPGSIRGWTVADVALLAERYADRARADA